MTDEIKIWAIDGSGEHTLVEPTNQTDTERLLEDTLVKHPEMLMSGLTLVGRQTPTAGGPLDLLGVDSNGQLVVFELKRGTLTRDAVAQVIDYGSYLESMDDTQLGNYIAEQSGKNGIDKIDDFDEWYSQRVSEPDLSSLKPVRMALVGLGADDATTRMVDFLVNSGVRLSLLSFYGYSHAGATLLARQVRVEPVSIEVSRISVTRRERVDAREKAAAEHAEALGIDGLLKEIIESFTKLGSHRVYPITDGYTFYRREIKLPNGGKFYSPYSIRFTEDKRIRITFSPVAVHLCEEKFKNEQLINFDFEPPPNFPVTPRISEQWYCLLNEADWQEHKETLLDLASAVYAAWNEALQNDGSINGVC